MSKIIIKNGIVIDMVNKDYDYQAKDILIENNRIAKIGYNISEDVDKIIDATGKVVMPGLINCHNHSAMILFRGYSDDTSLMDWLQNKIWPVEDKLIGEQVYYGSLLACIEMIKSGTTTFNDMYFFSEYTAKAVEESKIRACLARCIMAVNDENDIRVKEATKLYEMYNNSCNGRLKVNIAPHTLYTCNKEAINISKNLCDKYNTEFHIHLDETKDEHFRVLEKYGKTPTQVLDEMGLIKDNHLILAHCVWQTKEDIELLKNIKGGIVHNPISNAKLASGIAPISEYIKNGILVGLGTDGVGSTNTMDMFEEMKVCNLLQKVKELDSTCINAYDTLKMATINGAKILGIENDVGSIEEGKKADIIIVNMSSAHQNPINDIYSNLVYTTTGLDVDTTIIDGNVIMENRKLNELDEDSIIKKCNEIAHDIFNK